MDQLLRSYRFVKKPFHWRVLGDPYGGLFISLYLFMWHEWMIEFFNFWFIHLVIHSNHRMFETLQWIRDIYTLHIYLLVRQKIIPHQMYFQSILEKFLNLKHHKIIFILAFSHPFSFKLPFSKALSAPFLKVLQQEHQVVIQSNVCCCPRAIQHTINIQKNHLQSDFQWTNLGPGGLGF